MIKKVVSLTLLVMFILCAVTSCGKNAIEEADLYVKKCNDECLHGCLFNSSYEKDRQYSYEVSVTFLHDKDELYTGEFMLIAEEVAEEIHPELAEILEKEESVSQITIFFYYPDGEMFQYCYYDGTRYDLYDLLS